MFKINLISSIFSHLRILWLILTVLNFLTVAAADKFTYEYNYQTVSYTVFDEQAGTCITSPGKFNHNETISPANQIYGNLTIPEVVSDGRKEYTVIGVGAGSFSYNSGLKTVHLPPSVRIIDDYAFSGCNQLSEIGWPDSLEFIGNWAFYQSNLTDLVLPFSLIQIGVGAFGCTAATRAILPPRLKDIAHHTFYHCKNLKEIIIPDSIKSIGTEAFYWCRSLESVHFPNSLEEIEERAFGFCQNLRNIHVGHSIRRIDNEAFDKYISSQRVVAMVYDKKQVYSILNIHGEALFIPKGTMKFFREFYSGNNNLVEIEDCTFRLKPYCVKLKVGETVKIIVSETEAVANQHNFSLSSFWVSASSPEIAVIDQSLEKINTISVTGISPGTAILKYEIHDVANDVKFPGYCYVSVEENSNINEVPEIPDCEIVGDSNVTYYDLNGKKINPNCFPKGIVIKKSGDKTEKIFIH